MSVSYYVITRSAQDRIDSGQVSPLSLVSGTYYHVTKLTSWLFTCFIKSSNLFRHCKQAKQLSKSNKTFHFFNIIFLNVYISTHISLQSVQIFHPLPNAYISSPPSWKARFISTPQRETAGLTFSWDKWVKKATAPQTRQLPSVTNELSHWPMSIKCPMCARHRTRS